MPARRTILLVEDDLPLRRLYRSALSLSGFDICEAGDGYEALRCLDSQSIDLVILDLALPTISGHTVRAELAEQSPDLPIIVVTGTTGEEIYQLDVDHLMHKPVSPEALVEAVRKHLNCRGRAARSTS